MAVFGEIERKENLQLTYIKKSNVKNIKPTIHSVKINSCFIPKQQSTSYAQRHFVAIIYLKFYHICRCCFAMYIKE